MSSDGLDRYVIAVKHLLKKWMIKFLSFYKKSFANNYGNYTEYEWIDWILRLDYLGNHFDHRRMKIDNDAVSLSHESGGTNGCTNDCLKELMGIFEYSMDNGLNFNFTINENSLCIILSESEFIVKIKDIKNNKFLKPEKVRIEEMDIKELEKWLNEILNNFKIEMKKLLDKNVQK